MLLKRLNVVKEVTSQSAIAAMLKNGWTRLDAPETVKPETGEAKRARTGKNA